MKLAAQLKAMGFADDQIAAATVDGKPLAKMDVKKPSRVDGYKSKTEALYSFELDLLQREGFVKAWWHESIRLRLADRTTYTPDFLVLFSDGRLRFVEVKGYRRDDAMVKFKVAREMYPWAEWRMIERKGSGWGEINI